MQASVQIRRVLGIFAIAGMAFGLNATAYADEEGGEPTQESQEAAAGGGGEEAKKSPFRFFVGIDNAQMDFQYFGTKISGGGPTTARSKFENIEVQRLRLGTTIGNNVDIEAQYGQPLRRDVDSANGADVEVKSFVGFYVSPRANMTDWLSIYGSVGYTSTQVRTACRGAANSCTDGGSTDSLPAGFAKLKGASYGAGMQFKMGETFSLTAEGMVLQESGSTQIRSGNLGMRFTF